MKLHLVAGEASGDARGAELMRALLALHPDCSFSGAGGPKMHAIAGGNFLDWAHEAVVGLWDVLKKYGYFKHQLSRMLREIAALKPDAVLFIDYPGFNLRLAKALRARHPHLKLLYYVSPQVWAWNRGRIPKMARFLDLMLCIFPFEPPLYQSSGLKALFVGHPMLDSLPSRDQAPPRDPSLIALLPGSREKEVRRIFPAMLETAREMLRRSPQLRFATAAASEKVAHSMREILAEQGLDESSCPISSAGAHHLMQTARAGMVASGTATQEAACLGLPMIIVYKVAWLTWVVGKRLIRVPFIGMPNLLAEKEIAPEFLQNAAQPQPMADAMLRLVHDQPAWDLASSQLREVVEKLGNPGAGARAAEAVLAEIRTH